MLWSRMSLLYAIWTLAVLEEIALAQTQYCPPPEDIAPCVCWPPVNIEIKPTLKCDYKVPSNENFTAVFQASSYPTYDFYQFIFTSNDDVTDLNVLTNLTFESFTIDRVPISEIQPWFLLQFAETLTDISISHTNITDTSFPFDIISDLAALERLELYSNFGITVFPLITSSSLRSIDFGYCAISSVPPGRLSGTPNYEYFSLFTNDITELIEGSIPLHAATNHVVLGGNSISSLQSQALYYTSLEEWESSDQLQLDLSENQLELLPAGSIPLPDGYVDVILSRNLIKSVEAGAFVFLQNSTFTSLNLYMTNNALTEIDEDAFREILQYASYAAFDKNPLSCGCNFAWVATDSALLHKLSFGTQCANGTFVSDLDVDAYLTC